MLTDDPDVVFPQDHQLRTDLTLEEVYKEIKRMNKVAWERGVEEEPFSNLKTYWTDLSVAFGIVEEYLEGRRDNLDVMEGLNEKGEKIEKAEWERLAAKSKDKFSQKEK
jgi:hypothetical protein